MVNFVGNRIEGHPLGVNGLGTSPATVRALPVMQIRDRIEQHARVRMLRRASTSRLSPISTTRQIHDADAIRDVMHNLVVRNEYVSPISRCKSFIRFSTCACTERRWRWVRHRQKLPDCSSARNRDALALTTGKLMRKFLSVFAVSFTYQAPRRLSSAAPSGISLCVRSAPATISATRANAGSGSRTGPKNHLRRSALHRRST